MYADHVPLLASHGQSPAGLSDLATFALLTIRQPFRHIPSQFRDVRKRGAKSKWLFGWKADGFSYLKANALELYDGILKAGPDTEEAIVTLLRVPGLGIIKSAFVAQMLGYDVACFDSRNAVKLKLPRETFRSRKEFSDKWQRRRVASYVAMTRRTGGAEFWWDDWCERVAIDRRMTAQEISALHLEVLQ